MKRAFVILIVSLLSCFVASAGQPLKDKSFSIGVGPSLESYGYIDGSDKIYGTVYSGIMLEPDWRFNGHWGLKCSLGAAWALSTNATDEWERPIYSVCNIDMAVIPYYELPMGAWYIDMGAVVGGRVRLPYMNTELSKYLMTFSASVGVDLRAGYHFCEKWGFFVQAQARRTVYDYLYNQYYSSSMPISGCLVTSIGLSYSF